MKARGCEYIDPCSTLETMELLFFGARMFVPALCALVWHQAHFHSQKSRHAPSLRLPDVFACLPWEGGTILNYTMVINADTIT